MMRSQIILLASAIAVVGSNSLSLSPISPAIAWDLRVEAPADIMAAAAAYGLATALGGLTLAPLGDRIGASLMLRLSMLVLAAALCASALAPTLLVLIIAQGVAGLAAGACLPAIYSSGAQIAPKGRESKILGYVLTGWTISMVLGVTVSGLVSVFFGWRYFFGGLAAVALLLPIAVQATAGWSDQKKTGSGLLSSRVFAVPGLAPALGGVVGFMLAFYGLYTYVGAHSAEALGRSSAYAAGIGLSYGVGFGFAAFLGGLLTVRLGPTIYLTISAIYVCIALVSYESAILPITAAIWGLANHLGMNLIVLRLTALDPTQRGAIMGLYSAATYVCVTLGAIAYRPLYDAFGFQGCAIASALCLLPVAILAARRREAAEPS